MFVAIGNIEFVLADVNAATSLFTETLGFRRAVDTQFTHPELGKKFLPITQGRAHVILTDATTGNNDVEHQFIKEHGSGIRDVWLTVCDLDAAIDAVQRSGGTVLKRDRAGRSAMIKLFDGLQHTLVERSLDQPELDDASGLGIFAVDHVAICLTPDEFYQVVGRYLSAFKLDVIHEEIVSTETMAMNSVALADSRRETKFVFVEPRQGKHKSQIQGFIDRFGGSGVHHVAFSVSNITNFVFRLQERHVEFFQVPSNYYVEVGNRIGAIDGDLRLLQQANVLVDRDSDGLLYQTFTKPIFERDTCFLGFVERQGSVGFGSGFRHCM